MIEIKSPITNPQTSFFILTKEKTTQSDPKERKNCVKMLAEVYRRLGECENLKENFQKAQEEIQKAINLLEKQERSEVDRALSEAYFLMSCTVNYQGKAESAMQALKFLDKGIIIIQNFKNLVETEIGKLDLETGRFLQLIFKLNF